MEITLDKIGQTEGLIKVSLTESDYQPGVAQKVKEYSKKANIKGFRPGKVPTGMIQKLYGKSILLEEINSLVTNELNNYLRQSDLLFLGEPMPRESDFESLNLDNPKDFQFHYQVGFAESFDLKLDDQVKVTRYAIQVDDVVINETIEDLQRRFGTETNPEVSEAGDILYGPLRSEDGGVDREIEIKLAEVQKNTQKLLIGLKNEDVVKLNPHNLYTDSHKLHHQLKMSHDDFEAMTSELAFTVKAIERTIPAEVNQDLFDKTFGDGKVTTEADFREEVRKSVRESFEVEETKYFDYQLREHIVKETHISLPDDFLKQWLLKTNKEITEQILEREYSFYSAELKWSLIRNKVVASENLQAEASEVVQEAKHMLLAQFGSSINLTPELAERMESVAHNYLQQNDGENYRKVYGEILNKKVLDVIKSKVSIQDKEVTLAEFREL